MMKLRKLLGNKWLTVGLELCLGVVFIYASFHKIADLPDFAHMIYNYKLTPAALINLLAIYLPWIELVAGVVLILGVLRIPGGRGAAALVGAMLLVFIGAIGINLARDNAIDCGCFEGSGTHDKTHAELFAEMWWVMAQDVGMLVMVALVLFNRPSAKSRPGEEKTGAPREEASVA